MHTITICGVTDDVHQCMHTYLKYKPVKLRVVSLSILLTVFASWPIDPLTIRSPNCADASVGIDIYVAFVIVGSVVGTKCGTTNCRRLPRRLGPRGCFTWACFLGLYAHQNIFHKRQSEQLPRRQILPTADVNYV